MTGRVDLHVARLAAALSVLAIAGGSSAQAQPDTTTRAEPAPSPPPPSPPPPPPSGQGTSDVEDVALEELLGLEMNERLGTTEAASRTTEDLLSAPATVTLIEHDEIRRSSARTIPDLLRLVPGVQVYQSAPGIFTVSIRGAGGVTGNNVVVTIDGIPIASAVDGSIPWEAIPVSVRDVERVEVVRGPVSTIYGANAYTGVINVVTYRGFGHEPIGAVRAELGVDHRFHLQAGVSARYVHTDRRVQQAFFGQLTYDDVYAHRYGPDAPPLARGGALGRLGLTLDAGQLDLELGLSAVRASEVEHLVADPGAAPALHSFAQLRFLANDGPSVLGRVGVWGRTRSLSRAGLFEEANPEGGFTYDGTRALRASAGLDVPLELHRTFSLTVGAQLDLDRIEAPYFQPASGDSVYFGYGVYGQVAWNPTDRWSVRAELRGDVPTVSGDLRLSYRGSIGYRGDAVALRLSGSSAFRAPTYVEAGARFSDAGSGLVSLEGQPGLASPRNDSAELALTFSPSARFHGSAVVYYTRLRNVMIEDFGDPIRRTFETDDQARQIVGVEVEGTWRPVDAFALSFGLGALQFVRADDELATIAVERQNAQLVGSLRAHGSALGDRLGWGASAALATARHYVVLSGIPPAFVNVRVPPTVQLGAMVEYGLSIDVPLFLSLRIESNLPHPIESPYLGASRLGTAVTVGLEYRRD